jgi:UDP-N-acetylmuramoyl-tripeptide--D-alanyl-D-alanine ligase
LAHLLGNGPTTGACSFGNAATDTIGQFARLPATVRNAVVEISEFPLGSIDVVCETLRPNVAVLTLAGLDHYKAFRTRDAAATEIARLAHLVPADGLVVVNADDTALMTASAGVKASRVTFGRDERADYRLVDTRFDASGRLTIHVARHGAMHVLPTRLLGRHMAVPVLAAIATAHHISGDWCAITERLAHFEPIFGRCSLVEVPGGPTFICDTTKAPLWSMPEAAAVLDLFAQAPRRTIVLGTLSDYPGASRAAYRKACAVARQHADRIIGFRHTRERLDASPEDLADGRALVAHSVREIVDHLRATALAGEVILLKGSVPADHLDRIAHAFREPVHCWLDTCGRGMNCRNCERMSDPHPHRWRVLKSLKRRLEGRKRIWG